MSQDNRIGTFPDTEEDDTSLAIYSSVGSGNLLFYIEECHTGFVSKSLDIKQIHSLIDILVTHANKVHKA